VPDEIRGDEVFAFVVAPKGIEADDALAQDLFGHCLQHLTYFKVPGYIAFVDALPLTASQKVSRGDVKTLARQRLEAGTISDLRHLKKRKKS
jgi:acyl-coenzyme A synthetase/AMP-(fatty) acid ligase